MFTFNKLLKTRINKENVCNQPNLFFFRGGGTSVRYFQKKCPKQRRGNNKGVRKVGSDGDCLLQHVCVCVLTFFIHMDSCLSTS